MLNKSPGQSLVWLLAFLGAGFTTAGLGSVFTVPALKTWYPKLRKPAWTPPDRVFGPVWTILYIQMAMAAWLVYRRTAKQPAGQRTAGRVALFV
jgi:tryptophan-rich sensory protein